MKGLQGPTVTSADILISVMARAAVNGETKGEDIELALEYAKSERPGLFEAMTHRYRYLDRCLHEQQARPVHGHMDANAQDARLHEIEQAMREWCVENPGPAYPISVTLEAVAQIQSREEAERLLFQHIGDRRVDLQLQAAEHDPAAQQKLVTEDEEDSEEMRQYLAGVFGHDNVFVVSMTYRPAIEDVFDAMDPTLDGGVNFLHTLEYPPEGMQRQVMGLYATYPGHAKLLIVDTPTNT